MRIWKNGAEKQKVSYADRRKAQNAMRERGYAPECGREACTNDADPAYVNTGTPLLYCEHCATLINGFNPKWITCTLENK